MKPPIPCWCGSVTCWLASGVALLIGATAGWLFGFFYLGKQIIGR